jgi:hypothetical protein
MNNIINVAEISLAVIQYSVAAALVGAAAFSTWTTKKSKLLTVAAVIAVLSLNSQAFAQSSSCSGQIADLQQQVPLNLHPQTIEGLTFSGDLTRAGALDAEGDTNGCLLAVHRAQRDLQ